MLYEFLNNTYSKVSKSDTRDLIQVEIGDSKQEEFHPQVKVLRWDNEVNFSVRLVHNEKSPEVTLVGNKITWSGLNIDSNFYELPFDNNTPEGGYEFEVILKEKPDTNVIEFTLDTKGLDFFYQPPMNQQVKVGDRNGRIVSVTETDAYDKDGNVIMHAFPEFIGSYAVYCSENKINWEGGKLYRAGKVGHIHRPKVIDSAGVEVWGNLSIDVTSGLLSVTIPQDFLDKAIYPIRHAAGLTFGYTTTPTAGIDDNGGTDAIWCLATSTPASNGTLTSITGYGKYNNSVLNFTPAIYSNVSSKPSARLAYTTTGTAWTNAYSWKTTDISYGSIVAGTQHWLGICYGTALNAIGWKYDSGTNELVYRGVTTWPDPAGTTTYVSERVGIYATYTASGGFTPVSRRTIGQRVGSRQGG